MFLDSLSIRRWGVCPLTLNGGGVSKRILSDIERYLGCFQFLPIMNNVAVNTLVEVLCEHMSSYLLGKITTSAIAVIW